MEKIDFKIDWLTIMFYNCSFEDIFNAILPETDVNEDELGKVLNSFYDRFLSGMGETKCFPFPYFNAYIPKNSVNMSNLGNVFIDTYTRIRIDMSGHCLDYLRYLGYDINYYVFDPLNLAQGTYEFTRVDAAYDLINTKSDFLSQCIKFCEENHTPEYRIGIGDRGAVKYEFTGGRSKQLRLGTGDNVLRIYDKRLEREQKDLLNDCPYIDEYGRPPDSWIRIEWQIRHKYANSIFRLPENDINDGLALFKLLYQRWGLREPSKSHTIIPMSDMWKDLFDWDSIPTIIQNAKVEQKPKKIFQSAEDQIERNIGPLLLFLAKIGKENFLQFVENRLHELQNSKDPSTALRWRRIKLKLFQGAQELGYSSIKDLLGLIYSEGELYLE